MTQQCPHCNTSNMPDAGFCHNCGLQLIAPVSQTLKTGIILHNRYRVVSLLGQGGFGAVYRAYDMSLKRACAVKENLETGRQAQEQFQQEASVLAGISHSNLPRVIDHFVLPGQGQYLVMDFVDGQDLDSILNQRGPLPVNDAVGLISQIADALTYLHSRSTPVIHRDIKPANIRVTSDGRAYLVDFGLVKLFATQKMTAAAARGVTPGYSPPEQYGQGGTNACSDIYALGATLYSLLTGQVPQESVNRAARDTLAQAHHINPQVPAQVSTVIHRAMALDPHYRYSSAAEFKAALGAALSAPTPGRTVIDRGTLVIPEVEPAAVPVRAVPRPASSPVSKPLFSGIAIGALVMGLVLVAVVVFGFMVLPGLLNTPTPETAVLVVTATPVPGGKSPSEGAKSADNPMPLPPSPTTEMAEPPPLPTHTPIPENTATPEPTANSNAPMDPNQGWVAISASRSGYTEVGLLRADGSAFRHLTSCENICDEPDFSPDGQWLAFERKYGPDYDWEIHIVRLDGEGERSLGKGRLPAWSPDGSRIAFETLDNKGNEQIWWMDANGGKREQLTWDDHPNRSPNWSPDGRSLVMMSKIGGHWQIVIFDLNSRGQTQITSGSVDKRFPVWSPDGQWITFNTLKSGSPDQIWIIKADGSQEVKLTDSGQNGRPTWSPDGSYLLFNAWVGDTWKIVRIALDGSGYQIISHGGGGNGDGQPDWTQ